MADATKIATHNRSETVSFKWLIENFNLMPYESREFIESSPFIISDGSKWCLRVYPQDDRYFAATRHIAISLRVKKRVSRDKVAIRFSVKADSAGSCSKIIEGVFKNINSSLTVYFSRGGLLGNMNPARNVDLTIEYDATFTWKGNVKTETSPPEFSAAGDDTNTLAKDMKRLLINQSCTDVTFKTAEEEIRAHKCVLSARSIVFDVMFSQDTKEANQDCIAIPDMTATTLRLMLLYIYTGEMNIEDADAAQALYAAADKYQLPGLKSKCSQFLASNLCARNVFDVIAMAEVHSDEDLKKSAKDYVLSSAATVLATQEWKTFIKGNPELASSIF